MQRFDVIVVGLGGIGSAALHRLARRRLRVCGVDRFSPAHAQGSSHGQSRLIRRAYFEHPGYVPLVDEAWRGWRELESETQTTLLHRTGLLLAGPPDQPVIRGTRAAADLHNLDIVDVTHAEALRRWPAFAFDPDTAILFEQDAGCLLVEACVQAHLQAAERLGATIRPNQPVSRWRATHAGIEVETPDGWLGAEQLVICGGPWSGALLAELNLPLRIVRKIVFWYRRCPSYLRMSAGCPAFGFETAAGFCYGFPAIDDRGVKVANHTGGEVIASADVVDRSARPQETAEIESFRRRHLPGLEGPAADWSVCLYTLSPDEHFRVGRHPHHARVIAACGFSGHGFKFAPAIGRLVADLADGEPSAPAVIQPLTGGAAGGLQG